MKAEVFLDNDRCHAVNKGYNTADTQITCAVIWRAVNLLIFGVFQVCMKVCKIQSKFVEVEVVVVHVNVKICTVASFAIVIAWLGYYHYFLSLSIMSAVKYRGCKDNVPLC